jgi:hypothetical protein
MRDLASLCIVTVVVGCGGSARPPDAAATTVTIGASGGVMLVPNGPALAIVPGALSADTAITVRARTSSVAGALSTVYDFEPAGLTFARPATLSIPVDAALTEASIVLTDANGAVAQTLPALVDNGLASAQITQLRSGFAGASQKKTRTVSGTFSTVYWADDGSKTTRPGVLGPPMSVVAAWVPAGSNYRRIAASVAPHPVENFTVDGVPEGPYFLEIDTVYPTTPNNQGGTIVSLFEFTTSTPDLSTVSSARADVQIETNSANLSLSVDGLLPWTKPSGGGFLGDNLSVVSSQANVYARTPSNAAVAGATSYKATFDWSLTSIAAAIGLPDASKGDVEYLYQRSTSPIGSGATQGVAHIATRFARLSDFTLRDAATTNLTVTLAEAPQTGALRANLGNSKWATLLADANPATVPSGPQGVSLLAIPRSIDFPDQPGLTSGTSLAYIQGPALTDVDYGTVAYGKFLDPSWKEVRYVLFTAQADVPQPGTSAPFTTIGAFISYEAMPADDEIVPVLGPPRSPKIQGRDAFQAQAGVGLHPTLSWSPPRLGSATSYTVTIGTVTGTPAITSVSLTVYGVTSLQIPNGLLQPGATYIATITANSAPWDSLDRPVFRLGVPSSYSDCMTAVFAP